jgi:uncharacterized protein (TIGR02266 family)
MNSARESYAFDRRSSPRVVIEVEVSLTSEAYFYAGLTGDVAEGGVFVPTYELIPIGSEIDIDIKLPRFTFRVCGRVRWLREAKDGYASGLGIAFEALDDKDRARVEQLCRHRAPYYYDVDDD